MKRIPVFLLLCALSFGLDARNEKYVNLFLGSKGDAGQLTPAASYPFGMVSVCPDSSPNQHGGYDYDVPEISGVSINRISGVGCYGVGGNVSVRPALPETVLKIVKGTEVARPGYYAAAFSNGARGEFTATRTTAVERYEFSREGDKYLYVDFLSSFEKRKTACEYKIKDDRTIDAWVASGTACARGQYKLYVRLHTDKPFAIEDTSESSCLLSFFDTNVEVRISVSPVDAGAAAEEVKLLSGKSFRDISRDAAAAWRDKLDKIDVKGGDYEQKVLFYTCLYRIYLSPMDVTSFDGRYKGTDGAIYRSDGRRHFSSWSMWDTFRTKFPMLVILEPELMSDMAASLVDLFRTGKKNWATPEESVPTVRTEHSVIMLLDAYMKGIRGFDMAAGYEGMKKEAAKDYPRKSLDNKMETSYDLWALGRVSEILGKNEEAAGYIRESEQMFEEVWKGNFMDVTDDFSAMKGNGMYQGTKWQYRWAAPQYLDKMIQWAGSDRLASELMQFFDGGNFNQGNEPDIHTPFIFNVLGYPEESQAIVRKLLTDDSMVHVYGGNAEYPEPFVGRAFQNKPDGLAPEMDEDDGAMSAWYMFCQLGFYPLVVGTDRYEVVSPLFDKVKIVSGNNTIKFRVKGRKHSDDFLRNIRINGAASDGYSISHSVFGQDSRIVFDYSPVQ